MQLPFQQSSFRQSPLRSDDHYSTDMSTPEIFRLSHGQTEAETLAPCYPPNTRLTAFCPGLPGRAGTRKVKPIWILLKQETVSDSGISWATSLQTDNHASTPPLTFLPAGCPSCRPTNSVKALKAFSALLTSKLNISISRSSTVKTCTQGQSKVNTESQAEAKANVPIPTLRPTRRGWLLHVG